MLPTLAGPEIGVASTKAFTCQLMVLAALAVAAGRARGKLSDADEAGLVHGLVEIPRLMAAALAIEPQIEKLAREIAKSRDVLYLGRGTSYPLALEGALKLKEISYIHAEGYPAGEMKHGPNALIDENLPVVVLATRDASDPASVTLYEKSVSNIKEVKARDGIVISIVTQNDHLAREASDHLIELPPAPELLVPLLEIIPLQLLAYHIAVRRGCDVDQPRNLAKSVTVE
jgi:glucosamine--fructose-6-phosphate aminotransferase (isomerizing)